MSPKDRKHIPTPSEYIADIVSFDDLRDAYSEDDILNAEERRDEDREREN